MSRYSALTQNDSAGVQELIPVVILNDIIATSARQEVFMPHMRRFDVTGAGDDYNIPQAGALTFGSTTPGAAPLEQAFNTNARTATPALRVCDVIVPITILQSTQMSLEDAIRKEAGLALALDHDALCAALWTEAPTSPDHEWGTDASPLTYAGSATVGGVIPGMRILNTANAPKPYVWIIHHIQAAELLIDNTFIDASVKGTPVLTQGVQDGGFLTQILSIGIYCSDQIVESSGLHSMMFSKNAALAWVFKRLIHPITGANSEVLGDMEWNAARRSVEMNLTYFADAEGAKGTSTTSNTWLVDIIS